MAYFVLKCRKNAKRNEEKINSDIMRCSQFVINADCIQLMGDSGKHAVTVHWIIDALETRTRKLLSF
jgi:hypothetical protein